MKDLISVGILNYNGLKYLKKTIPAILKLEYPNFEVVVTDNNSSDGSIKYLESLNSKKIRIIKNKKNYGYSKGKNDCIKSCKGKYILLLDEDILIRNKKILQELVKLYKKNIGFIQVPLLDKGEDKTFYYGTYYSIYGLNMHRKDVDIKKILDYKNTLIRIVGPTGGCIFCSKKNWNKIGLFDESQGFHLDDVDIGPRSNILGFENYLYTKNYFIHLGVGKVDSLESYVKRFKLVFSGHARAMIKNYNLKSLFFRFPIFLSYQLLKAVRFSIKRKSWKILDAYFYSLKLFLKNLKSTLKERKKIQSKRVKKKDVFLNVKAPRF